MLWERVEQLAERAPSFSDLRFHGLQLIAARRLRERGDELPVELAHAERVAAVTSLAAPVVLRRVCAAYDGPIALMKGPEIAARYPDPALRGYIDLDLLVDDVPAAQRALLDAGFVLTGIWGPHVDLHHAQPLGWPGLPLGIELHSAPHFPNGLAAPTAAELLADAVPGRFAGALTGAPSPAAHALITAAHAWSHGALARISQLVDVALLAQEADPSELDALARRWGIRRLWRTTRATIDALLVADRRPPAAMRVCAPHLRGGRERTLLERHVEELAGPLFGLPPRRAAAQSARVLVRRARPGEDESWPRKLYRARRALRNAQLPHSAHESLLPPEDLLVGAPAGLEPALAPEGRTR